MCNDFYVTRSDLQYLMVCNEYFTGHVVRCRPSSIMVWTGLGRWVSTGLLTQMIDQSWESSLPRPRKSPCRLSRRWPKCCYLMYVLWLYLFLIISANSSWVLYFDFTFWEQYSIATAANCCSVRFVISLIVELWLWKHM